MDIICRRQRERERRERERERERGERERERERGERERERERRERGERIPVISGEKSEAPRDI